MPAALRFAIRGIQVGATAVSLYQAAITLAGYAKRPRPSPTAGTEETSFAIVICARNEGAVVGDLIRDLQCQDYPADRFTITVVAHNCTDDTAAVAACHGANVIALDDGVIGKVEPMKTAVAIVPKADYVGIFDADARIPAGYLREVAAAAGNRPALQVETVAAPPVNELEAAYGFGRASRNVLWWRPRARLGLNTTLTGSGLFIRPGLFADLLPKLRTGTDDLEMTTRLAMAGVPISFLDSTQTYVEEPAALGPSINQRSRWVRGHMGTISRTWVPLMWRGMRGDFRALDLAIFLLVPTRVLTRTGVTLSLLLRVLVPGTSIAAGPMVLAAAGEALIPIAVCTKAGILTFDRKGARLAMEHGVLGFLWYPIGIWSLITARRMSWGANPRRPRTAVVVE